MPYIKGVLAGALLALAVAAPATAHEGNPNYSSEVSAIAPALPGLEARVLNHDDRVELVWTGAGTLVVEGYRGEPYLRFGPDGRVEVNRRSPAAYLNEDRFAQVEVPGRADHHAEPEWQTVASGGRYDWHDHRIHWMGEGTLPPQVEDEGQRTKVFDWRLPLAAGATSVAVRGKLTWLGTDDGGFPLAAPISLLAAAGAGMAVVLFVRRRRRTRAGSAAAHVYFNPAEAPSDGYATLNLEVPHGCEGSPTTKVRVQVPPSVPSVTPGRSPFWNITTKEGKKDKVELHGEEITSGVSEIVYTARQPLPDGELDVLPVSLKMPAGKKGEVVYFPTVQECEKGKTSWIQIPAEGESAEELESPSPAVTLVAAEGEHEAAADAESQEVQTAGATIDEDDGAPVWLAVVALALGALGLLAGVSGLMRSRRNQA